MSTNNLANVLYHEGHYAGAEKLYRKTLDIKRRVLGPEHPDTLRSMGNLAFALRSEHHYAEAEKLDRETLEARRQVLGPGHPDTLFSMNSLAADLGSEGHYAEAEKVEREGLDIRRRVLGLENPDTLRSLEFVALDLSHEGRYGDAENLFQEAIQSATKANSPGILAMAWYNFACGAAIAGRHDEALRYLDNAMRNGYKAFDATASDPDLKSLHGDPRFDGLLAKARQANAPTAK
jgi:non-specific serine/threonine protein kinase/serine/threonine-protein kinase